MELKKIRKRWAASKISFIQVFFLSRILNWFYESVLGRTAQLPKFTHVKDLVRVLDRFDWNEDRFSFMGKDFKHGWMIGARVIQWFLNRNRPLKKDCDEFATYAANGIKQIGRSFSPVIVTIRWVDTQGAIKGHNVCVYSYGTKHFGRLYGHLGNYGHFKGFFSIYQVAKHICHLSKGEMIAYAVATPDLEFLYHEKVQAKKEEA